MKKKTDLLIIVILINLIAIITTYTFVNKFGFIKIERQTVSFLLLIILSYFLYHEKPLARWIFVILLYFAGIMGIKGSIDIITNYPLSFESAFFIFMTIVYLISGSYIAFIRKWDNVRHIS